MIRKLLRDVFEKKLQLIRKNLESKLAEEKQLPHVHDWKMIHDDDVYARGTDETNSLPIGKVYVYECQDPSCKKIKTQRTY